MKIYQVYHFHDISDEQEEWKIIGYFSSKEKAKAVVKAYKKLPGFKDVPPVVGWTEIGGQPSWEGGFSTWLETLQEMHEEDGTTLTILEDEEEEDLVLEVPYWAKDESPQPSETSEQFAHRLMQAQDIKDYPQDPESEFYQLTRWAENLRKYPS